MTGPASPASPDRPRRSALRARMSAQAELTAALLTHSSDVVVVCDLAGEVCFISPALREIFGHDPDTIADEALRAIVHPDDVDDVRRTLRRVVAGRVVGPLQARVRHANGSWRVVEASASAVRQGGRLDGLVLNVRDVTDRLVLERALAHRASHDDLTGLANRTELRARLATACDSGDGRLAVLHLALDGFWSVNGAAGHPAGDALLVEVAARLRAAVRAGELVARLGGDEFAVLLRDVHAEAAVLVAARLRAAVSRPMHVGQRELAVRASVGVAFAETGVSADELLRNAELALRRAKASGRDRVEVYTPALHTELSRRHDLEAALRAGLRRGEFELHYQPIVDLRDGSMAGAEALLRWRRPDATLAAPADFLDVAEDTGLIAPLGWWAFDTAVAQLQAWRRDGLDVGISVNLSARQLAAPTLVSDVLSRLARLDVPPTALTLEITETVLVEQLEAAGRRLHALRAEGVVVALDDFGTGYCGLGYLRGLSVDVLKLDRSFVAGLGRDHEHTALVRAIVALAHDLELVTVAEGVESLGQVSLLRQMGATLAQGYLFEAPRGPLRTAAHARDGFGPALLAAAG